MNMPCLSCSADVPEEQARFFLRTFLCPACHKAWSDFRSSVITDLETFNAVMDTTIQNAIVSKKVTPASVATDKLSALITCATAAKAHVGSPWQQIRSSASTKPNALSAGGVGSSNKLLAADLKSET